MQGTLAKSHILTAIAGACLLAGPAPAEERPPLVHQTITLDADTGCFDYRGDASVFEGRFTRGAYIGISMDDPDRIPVSDVPEFKTSEPGFWFGPLPESGRYSFMFIPSYLHGTTGTVLICSRTVAP